MSLFRVKHASAEIDDTHVVVNDFIRKTPYWSYRTRDYQLFDPLVKFRETLDAYLEKLFSGIIDEGNGDVLDNMVSDMVRQAERDLERQRTEHRDMIVSLGRRAQSDRTAFQRELDLQKIELERICRETEELRARLYNNKFKEDKRHA